MCARVLVPALLVLLVSSSAFAAVEIDIDKDTQTMTVSVDGATKYTWPVSSGLPSYETPNGNFKAFRMEEDHYSKEWDDAPMPHSIFFTKKGHAIHGTDVVKRLGNPASHGCVRLSRDNAATLFELVKKEGVLNTTVTLSGSSQVALARNPQRRNDVAARRTREPRVDTGTARSLPPPQQIAPQEANTGGYYYDEYGRPVRTYRRRSEAESYAEQQPYARPRYYYSQQPYQPQPGYYARPGYYYVQPYGY
ncbi:L,D-transpeptidase [Bradyrhizobium sp. LHD-71]|uniref:L,D-transpeptidase n=1 Tax=Bradyrhizobium sp. LHD-71 TaxID=3072141 RepID=UPI00280D8DBA|nr:L,D-transpeptidase [Bradyrhizobium sp. LHD-71]MDQ8727830.1 L,D-transpeptidase [Bradyrhizobium sp. LHD-71]